MTPVQNREPRPIDTVLCIVCETRQVARHVTDRRRVCPACERELGGEGR